MSEAPTLGEQFEIARARAEELELAISRIAREAGVGSCSFDKGAWLMTIKRILGTCERAGYDILGEKIERK